ncbi:uncharacterized protein [Fopius arisanus]|uniref:SH2 domain-containing protein n=2 Tax=Fopius arisanus TaxID=64838 RepID=A0A9R1T8W4_9HYME|nr:PREDICTED: uncharacterized protein LOC105267540 [Fopius arisanus]XP_011304770.1 PREDICTED: uncharacterized protein LOC105267540 [Fopius arisanus]
MLTAMCPNCRHRFPVPGCCNPGPQDAPHPTDCNSYYGSLLVPRGYTGGGCFINAPTIIQGPAIIQSTGGDPTKLDNSGVFNHQLWRGRDDSLHRTSRCHAPPDVQINTTCDLTGGTVTITTPSIQSGGCLIQSTESGYLVQSPTIEIRPKLSGGGCVVQKRLSTDFTGNLSNLNYFDDAPRTFDKMEEMIRSAPSGCQELPGTRSNEEGKSCCCRNSCCDSSTSTSANCTSIETSGARGARSASSSGVQIQVNATVQMPPNGGQCTVNITATTSTGESTSSESGSPTTVRVRNNFNGGGLMNHGDDSSVPGDNERKEDAPTTPLSWLTPCPWGFDNFVPEKDVVRLQEIKRLLNTSGWYHEGLSWQQSEKLLKNSEVGRWLLRDSSDSRYAFAVSVQTTRGPTSVRILHSFGRFRLDAEPTIAHAMPTFDCPIKMLEYYVQYSKKIEENQRHVWVDYSGLLFSHIYLTQPVVKEVRSLSHMARLAIDRSGLNTKNLPAPIRNYINEYPYSF